MAREFVPCAKETIDEEFDDLVRRGKADAQKLERCMERVEDAGPNQNPSPGFIQDFGEGLLELRHENGRYKGRILYYEATHPKGTEDLVILRVFRKDTQKTPQTEVTKARNRMAADKIERAAGRRPPTPDQQPETT